MTTPIAASGRTSSAASVLSVRALSVRTRHHELVSDVSFDLRGGERVGLIGESGSGKTLTALGVLGLLGDNLTASGSARLVGVEHELIGASEEQLAKVHGRVTAMVFQEPMTALNPTMRVRDQVAETLLIHDRATSRRAARDAAVDLLRDVGLPDPQAAARAYPHQLSGGQRQRVVLAIALANDPAVIVCDEPTTALDVTVQALVLDHITRGVDRRGAALLFISHDLAVVATVCSRVLVMYGGRVVEAGPVSAVLTSPRHRYTEGLVGASMIESTDERGRLRTIPGSVPAPGRFPIGCVFANRCPAADDECRSQPVWTSTGPDAGFACHHPSPPRDRLDVADG